MCGERATAAPSGSAASAPRERRLPLIGAPTFDLQAHSTASDGALAPAEVVARAAEAGVELLALTDHDTVAGVDEALAAADATGGAIRVVSAIEISALDDEHEDLHVCAYLVDHRDPGLLGALEAARADRHARAARMIQALRDAGLRLDVPREQSDAGMPVGRPHLAAAVLACEENGERLAREGLGTASEVLEAYLLPGRPGYSSRSGPTVAEAVQTIHAAGGIAVWAHPFWDVDDPEDVRATIARFAAMGFDGVEAFYVAHSAEQTRIAYEAARAHGLLTTGSSDFHGPEHPEFHAFRAFDLCGLEPQLGPLAA